MTRLTENKIVLIVRRTRFDELVARFNTEAQARFYVEHLGADFSDYQQEDKVYKAAVRETEGALSRLGRLQVVDRTFVPSFIFGSGDTVVALGQDGLVANTLKYLSDQPLIGVNPDETRWEGALLPFTVPQLDTIVREVFDGLRPVHRVTIAEARLNDGSSLCGVNDLFIGPKSHTSAHYTIRIGDRSEVHSSSGVIVSTGLGSTGWLRSVIAGATGITAALTARTRMGGANVPFAWDSDYLCFSVREPWASKTSSAEITFGKITAAEPLILSSRMPEDGVIFSDGMEADCLQFNSGAIATICLAKRKGTLVA